MPQKKQGLSSFGLSVFLLLDNAMHAERNAEELEGGKPLASVSFGDGHAAQKRGLSISTWFLGIAHMRVARLIGGWVDFVRVLKYT